ncbi:hypothetical protein SAMN03159338_1491 [Sphingomonas sp. NFR04]|uniref:hypothetical protein n=1 Tax=Sphingomonas sp. NFR04 TaxID=1566283 RepID=UPI0008E9222C|nr:hypothetical protein [Sphingomonas sp. NFR04]SFJ47412.1 hypothetical protein SAMN03159338_1491 [Sphingomonas sp. NFR04]
MLKTKRARLAATLSAAYFTIAFAGSWMAGEHVARGVANDLERIGCNPRLESTWTADLPTYEDCIKEYEAGLSQDRATIPWKALAVASASLWLIWLIIGATTLARRWIAKGE